MIWIVFSIWITLFVILWVLENIHNTLKDIHETQCKVITNKIFEN